MEHTLRRQDRKYKPKRQKMLDDFVRILKEEGKPLSGNELNSRTTNYLQCRSNKAAAQVLGFDEGKRFVAVGIRSKVTVYGLKEWYE